jgi:hypothetical protein
VGVKHQSLEGQVMATLQRLLEHITQKWWFYLAILVLFFLPSYSSVPYDPRRASDLITAVLSHPLIYSFPRVMPLFKIVPVLLVLALVIYKDKITRLFDGYVALTILLFALFQNMALTAEFGYAVIVGNVVVYSFVALSWFSEVFLKANVLTFRRQPLWRYWVIPVAFLAYWFPVNAATLGPDFSPSQLVTNSAGLTLCMMLPLYLAILILCYPTINRPILRIASFAGVITAGLNILQWFFLTSHIWMGIVHLPLLTISLYGLILAMQKRTIPAAGNNNNKLEASTY